MEVGRGLLPVTPLNTHLPTSLFPLFAVAGRSHRPSKGWRRQISPPELRACRSTTTRSPATVTRSGSCSHSTRSPRPDWLGTGGAAAGVSAGLDLPAALGSVVEDEAVW